MTDVIARLSSALDGRYRIERELGAGGMANVYLAHDLRHDRKVALKVLKPELAVVVGAERFLAEIKTTANLQHPHILALYDSGQVDGSVFYVMPFVDGESLRDRLDREKQLPIDAALGIAREVADALGYAHANGVVHRDIKPENILLHGGHALVADFGIALAAAVTGGSRMTETGMSLGTPTYMSPEQAMGERTLDARTDIYALGCVLYEMLTGDPPFTASTAQAIVAKVLTEKPAPIVARRTRVPEHVEEAVLTALEKLPADRFATTAEFVAAFAGEDGAGRTTGPRSGARRAATPAGGGIWRAATVAFAVLSLALAGVLRFQPDDAPLPLPKRIEVQIGEPTASLPVVIVGAPDGASYLYCSSQGAVVLRRWQSLQSTPLGGPVLGCVAAAYSPDSRFVAVVGIPTSLQIYSVNGDVPRREVRVSGIGDMSVTGGNIDWAEDGALYLASTGGVLRVSLEDGSTTTVAPATSSRSYYGVDVLPGGRHAIVVTAATAGANAGDTRVGVLDLESGALDSLTNGVVARFVAPDRLLVVRGDQSMAVGRFDPKTRRTQGLATVLPDSIVLLVTTGYWQGAIDLADDGTLYYVRGGSNGSTPALVDRTGRATLVDPTWTQTFLTPRLSPDGRRMSIESSDLQGSHAIVRDLRSGAVRRLQTPGTQNSRSAWLPDGSGLSVLLDRDGGPYLYRWRTSDDVATLEPRYDPRGLFGAEWSRDGRWLVLRTDDQAPGKADIVALRPDVDSVAVPVVASPEASEYSPTISPDARWLAYVSNESGRFEVHVTDFPGGREKWQISSRGGSEPAWSADGRELYYVSDDHFFMAASIAPGPSFRVAGQRRLFSTDPFAFYGVWARNYDVAPDGRFLMLQRPSDSFSSVVVVQNWLAGLADAGTSR